MDDGYAGGQLQIYSVEESGADSAVCAVRCIDGTVYSGQPCRIDTGADTASRETPPLTLNWINIYGKLADVIKPPYSAMVHFTGESVNALHRGVTLTSMPGNQAGPSWPIPLHDQELVSAIPSSGYPLQKVSRYLLAGHPVLDVTELTKDTIGGSFRVPGGSSVLTDGSFIWRLDLASYVQHYSIDLPQGFLTFIENHEYEVPSVERKQLLEISFIVSRTLRFHSDPGAGPRSSRAN